LACERFAREVGAKKPATKPAPSTQAETSPAPDESEPEPSVESPAPLPPTDTIRDEEADRALEETPVPQGAAVVSSASTATPPPAPRATSKQKTGKQRVERPTIEIEGKRAMVVEALLHFDGEAEPRIVSWR
jgi:ParB family chromosome partitioning protein